MDDRLPHCTCNTITTTDYYLEPTHPHTIDTVRRLMESGECWYCDEFVVGVRDGFNAGSVRSAEGVVVARYTTVTRTKRLWEW
jgi:hypothetical protein